jgi:hypothetical protein
MGFVRLFVYHSVRMVYQVQYSNLQGVGRKVVQSIHLPLVKESAGSAKSAC